MSGAHWKPWAGGKCPLGHVYVEVRHRDGVTALGDACEFDPASWLHETGKFDIVEYRKVRR